MDDSNTSESSDGFNDTIIARSFDHTFHDAGTFRDDDEDRRQGDIAEERGTDNSEQSTPPRLAGASDLQADPQHPANTHQHQPTLEDNQSQINEFLSALLPTGTRPVTACSLNPAAAPFVFNAVHSADMNEEEAALTTDEIFAVSVATATSRRMPQFWRKDPRLWFYQMESHFQTANIRKDIAKYNIAVTALEGEAAKKKANVVGDIISNPPAEDKYEALKACIVARLTDSPEKQLDRMLNECTLGDSKPSELYRKMSRLAGDRATEAVL